MTYETTRFGTIEVDTADVVTFNEGIYGFANLHRFVIIQHNENSPYRWMQSLDDGKVAFLIISPWVFKEDYAPEIPDKDAQSLGVTDTDTIIVYSIVTIPPGNPQGITANLAGPIIINPETLQAKQVVVEGDTYTTRHSIIDEMKSKATAKAVAG